MNNNLPIKIEKQSIFKRFISFIKNLFHKKEQENYIIKQDDILEENFKNQYKYEINNIELDDKIKPLSAIERIIQIIEKEPKMLRKLDVKKLETIDNYYIEQINEYKKKIANME